MKAPKEVRECSTHGLTDHRQRHDHNGFRCVKCETEKVARHRREKKQILVNEKGGCCENCGYDRYIGALDFHHRDRTTKSFGMSGINFASSLEKLRVEAAKCDLLCATCHREAEAGLI